MFGLAYDVYNTVLLDYYVVYHIIYVFSLVQLASYPKKIDNIRRPCLLVNKHHRLQRAYNNGFSGAMKLDQ